MWLKRRVLLALQIHVKRSGVGGKQVAGEGSEFTSSLTHRWAGLSPGAQKEPSVTRADSPQAGPGWPRGADLAFLPSLLTPEQGQIRPPLHDKVLPRSRRRKERGSFSAASGGGGPQEPLVTWSEPDRPPGPLLDGPQTSV